SAGKCHVASPALPRSTARATTACGERSKSPARTFSKRSGEEGGSEPRTELGRRRTSAGKGRIRSNGFEVHSTQAAALVPSEMGRCSRVRDRNVVGDRCDTSRLRGGRAHAASRSRRNWRAWVAVTKRLCPVLPSCVGQ